MLPKSWCLSLSPIFRIAYFIYIVAQMVLCNNHQSSRACSARSVYVTKMNRGFVCLERLLVWPFEGRPSSIICSTDCIKCMMTMPGYCSHLLRITVAFDSEQIWGTHESNCSWKYGKQGAFWEVPRFQQMPYTSRSIQTILQLLVPIGQQLNDLHEPRISR